MTTYRRHDDHPHFVTRRDRDRNHELLGYWHDPDPYDDDYFDGVAELEAGRGVWDEMRELSSEDLEARWRDDDPLG